MIKNFLNEQEKQKKKILKKLDRLFRENINGGTIMALEVHVNTRDQHDPCYKYDAVAAVFMVIHNESA